MLRVSHPPFEPGLSDLPILFKWHLVSSTSSNVPIGMSCGVSCAQEVIHSCVMMQLIEARVLYVVTSSGVMLDRHHDA